MAEKRSVSTVIIGIVVLLFAVFGIVCAVIFGANKISTLSNHSKQKAEYEKFLAPVVMNDPDEFDDVSKADMSQLLEASIWAVLNKDIKPTEYEYSDEGMLIPQKEIEVSFKTLFGDEVKPEHRNAGELFNYDETKKSYIVPITGVMPTYIPKVYDISKKSNIIYLTVGYLRSQDWETDADGKMIPPEPSKYMKIALEKKDKKYYIMSIKDTDPPEIAK